MPSGVYPRVPRVPRVTIRCEVCGVERQMMPAQARQRTGRFCSKKCEGASRKLRVALTCPQCSGAFEKRRDHLALSKAHHCSRACATAARRMPNAKWRDPMQIRSYMSAYIEKNREEHNKRSREWSKANRPKRLANARARRAAPGFISSEEWTAVLNSWGGRCLACGKSGRIEMDHVTPVAKGGTHTVDNVQPLCRGCNAAKGTKVIDYRPARQAMGGVGR